MGLMRPTYQSFREFLGRVGCEEAFDRAFYNHNHATLLDKALWEAAEAEFIFAHAFDWAATPEGSNFWRAMDQKWNELIYRK